MRTTLGRRKIQLWLLVVAAFVAGAGLMGWAAEAKGEQAAKPAQATPEPTPTGSPKTTGAGHGAAAHRAENSGACLVDQGAVEDLARRTDEIEGRARELQAREQELQAQKRAIEEESKRLTVLRDEIDKLQGVVKKANEEKVQKVVETLESMPPKGAAQVMSGIDEALAVSAMGRLSTSKLAKILNLMEPEKSARLTEKMSGVIRTRANVSANVSPKGGAAE